MQNNKSSAIVLTTLILFFTHPNLRALTDTIKIPNTENKWYRISPINQISLRSYYLSTNHPFAKYNLINSEGDFIKRGINSFLVFDGGADAFDNLLFRYKIQLNNLDKVSLKRLHLKYRSDAISLTLGVDTVWIGHGYHGSLLHSTNAPPYNLMKFKTERSFRIPYIGKFDYMLFHGWLRNFKILGQRITWKPIDILEFGINQTVVYNQNYKLWEYYKVISATEENIPGSKYDNDQRGSFDIAIYLPFLKKISFINNGKIYVEYAGEDIWAWWQKEDKVWYGPFGFDFFDIGNTYGLFLSTKTTDFRVEYSRNYISYPWFHDFYRIIYQGRYRLSRKWYAKPRDVGFTNGGVVMGHHMGPMADDLYFEIIHKYNNFNLKLFYDIERHALVTPGAGNDPHKLNLTPETLSQYGIEIIYRVNKFRITSNFLFNHYKNVDYNSDPLYGVVIHPGVKAEEYIIGLTLSYLFTFNE